MIRVFSRKCKTCDCLFQLFSVELATAIHYRNVVVLKHLLAAAWWDDNGRLHHRHLHNRIYYRMVRQMKNAANQRGDWRLMVKLRRSWHTRPRDEDDREINSVCGLSLFFTFDQPGVGSRWPRLCPPSAPCHGRKVLRHRYSQCLNWTALLLLPPSSS